MIGLATGLWTMSGPHDSGLVKEPTWVAGIRTEVGTLDTMKETSGLRWATRTASMRSKWYPSQYHPK